MTDPNNQTTSIAYDTFGRAVSTTLPGETSGDTTSSATYCVTCANSGAQTPCAEEDSTQRLNNNTTLTVQHFYDGDRAADRDGDTRPRRPVRRAVHRLRPATGKVGFESQPYFVSGAAILASRLEQPGGHDLYLRRAGPGADEHERPLTGRRPPAIASICPSLTGLGSGGCYEQTTVVDANSHQTATLADALGRTAASETFTGNSPSTYTLFQQTIDTL